MRSCQNINDEYKQRKNRWICFFGCKIDSVHVFHTSARYANRCLSLYRADNTFENCGKHSHSRIWIYVWFVLRAWTRDPIIHTKNRPLAIQSKNQKIIHKSWIILCGNLFIYSYAIYWCFLRRWYFVWHVPKLFHNGAINRQDEFQVQKTIPRTK